MPDLSAIHAEFNRTVFSGRGSLLDVRDRLCAEMEEGVMQDGVWETSQAAIIPPRDIPSSDPLTRRGLLNAYRLIPRNNNLSDVIPPEGYPIQRQAMIQICQWAGIPHAGGFIDKVGADHPKHVAQLLTGIMADQPANRLFRCLGGVLRAFLSDRYRMISSYDVLVYLLQRLQESGGKVLEGSVTDTHFRIKMISTEIFEKLEHTRTTTENWYTGGLGNQEWLSKVGARSLGNLPTQAGVHTAWPCVTFSNSETGHGALSMIISILMAICYNLASVTEQLAKIHLGEKLPIGVYTPETIDAESKVIQLKIRDLLGTAFDQKKFTYLVDQVRPSLDRKIPNPRAAFGAVIKNSSLVDGMLDSLVDEWYRQQGKSAWDSAQIIAEAAKAANADRAVEIEQIAGHVALGRFNSAIDKETHLALANA